jgi:hypothetical protein
MVSFSLTKIIEPKISICSAWTNNKIFEVKVLDYLHNTMNAISIFLDF